MRQEAKSTSERDAFLSQFDDETQVRILKELSQRGVKANDPLFTTLLFITGVQEKLEAGPTEISSAIDQGVRQFLDSMDAAKHVAVSTTEERIASTVETLIQKTHESKSQVTFQSIAWAGAFMFTAFVLGWCGSTWYRIARQSQVVLDPSEARKLTLEEAKNLEWAMSSDGRYARKIVDWNEDLIGGQCEDDAREFVQEYGITKQIGLRNATSGYCWLWVQPPEKRTFEPVNP